MADDVKVVIDTEKMRMAAKTLENQISIIKNCYDSIGKDAAALKGTYWDGESSHTYSERMGSLCTNEQVSGKVSAGTIVEILNGYLHSLDFAADEYDRSEGRATGKMEGLVTNVFGV